MKIRDITGRVIKSGDRVKPINPNCGIAVVTRQDGKLGTIDEKESFWGNRFNLILQSDDRKTFESIA